MGINGVDIELFPLVFDKKKFSFDKFFASVIKFNTDDFDEGTVEPLEKLEDFNIRLRRREFRKKALTKTTFQVGANTKIGVQILAPFKKCKRPTGIMIDARTNTRITSLNVTKNAATGQVLGPEDLKRTLPLGNEDVDFEEAEQKAIKSFVPESFVLIGFKDRSRLKPYHFLEPALFVVPDEDRVAGSGRFTDALTKAMLQKNQIAIAKVRLSDRATLRFCALVPQAEKPGSEKTFKACGFHMILLPFADDLRRLDEKIPECPTQPSRQQVDTAMKIIYEFSTDSFSPSSFENPSLHQFYSVLEAFALNQEAPAQVLDTLQPDTDALNEKEDILEEFNEMFNLLESYDTNLNQNNGFSDHEGDKLADKKADPNKTKRTKGPGKTKAETKTEKSDDAEIFEEDKPDPLIEIEQLIKVKKFAKLSKADLVMYLKSKDPYVDEKLPKSELIKIVTGQ